MDENAIIAAVKRFSVAVSSDLEISTLHTQERLQVLAEVLGKEIAILAPHQVRWLSLYTALCNINKQLGPLTVYYVDRAMDGDALADRLSNNLTQTTFVLMLHGIGGVLAPLQRLTKGLQSADSGMPAVIPLVQQVKDTLHEQFLRDSSGVAPDDPGSSCGKAFGDLVCSRRPGVNSNLRIHMIKSSDARIVGQLCGEKLPASARVACMVLQTKDPRALVLWHNDSTRRGGPHFVTTTANNWSDCVSNARGQLAQVAKHAVKSLSDRFPQDTQSLLELSQWLLPEYWGLNAAATETGRQAAVEQNYVKDFARSWQSWVACLQLRKEYVTMKMWHAKSHPSSTPQCLFVTWVGRTAESSGSSAASCRTISISCLTD
jgi:hypothetical protein